MEYTLQQRAELIVAACMEKSGTNPYEIFHAIAREDYVRIHGPEHHVLDGACILTAFRNAGENIDLQTALQKLMVEGLRMPGAACGLWGVCGAVTSIGTALAIIDGTGPSPLRIGAATWSTPPRHWPGWPKPAGQGAVNVTRSPRWSRRWTIFKNDMA